MTKYQHLSCPSAAFFLFFAFGAAAVEAAGACPKISYSAERSKLQQFLSSSAVPRDDVRFLVKGVEQRVREIPQNRLNARGLECGVQTLRALVLGCVNETMPASFRSLTSPSRKTGKTLWGKANVSGGEAVVIGMFHACRGGATEAFLLGN
ncbi:hypothetical protein [Ensifer sp. SSB1]|jgi:hypothetical protein|uniref:hypothetical protein n=1 Tax=Ensifer sp. SSB1 TaxID=2795385 RepID=UPI001A44F2D5|nr:hypothetical protein [Ensifer sp. SSB1]MBK5569824.1 hypothetical protein [Ensifer sp. SSB1]